MTTPYEDRIRDEALQNGKWPVTNDHVHKGHSLTDSSANEAWRQRQAEVPQAPTKYNQEQQKKAMEERRGKIVDDVSALEKDIKDIKGPVPITGAMNWVERAIRCCGGESKVAFLDVTHTFIKVATRVPMNANIFQFLPEHESNPRFHKVVTKVLMQMPFVHGVQWIPQDGGAVLLVDLKDNRREDNGQ